MSDSGDLLTYAIIGLIFGIGLFFGGFKRFREKKLIENTPTSKVRSLAMGLVEIYGQAIPQKPEMVIAPFSGKECVYCKYTVEEYRRSGKHSRWVIVKQGSLGDLFYVQDDTGRVLVDAKGAEVNVPASFTLTPQASLFNIAKAPDKAANPEYYRMLRFMDDNGIKPSLSSRRFKEFSIFPDESVYVMGTAGDNPFVDEATAQKNEADIMIQKGKSFYYISDKPEKDVIKTFKWRVITGFYGGAALILVCLFIIFAYMGIL